jgi:hypothetical protein
MSEAEIYAALSEIFQDVFLSDAAPRVERERCPRLGFVQADRHHPRHRGKISHQTQHERTRRPAQCRRSCAGDRGENRQLSGPRGREGGPKDG